VAVLLVLAALALVVVTLIGMGAERRGTHRAYQANTRARRVLSFFALACAIISRRGVQRLSSANFQSSLSSIPRLANIDFVGIPQPIPSPPQTGARGSGGDGATAQRRLGAVTGRSSRGRTVGWSRRWR
jgi:hypothetical protein